MTLTLHVTPHPTLLLGAFVTTLPRPLGELPAVNLLHAVAPLQSDDDVRGTVRDLLRFGGFKPTGRSKPSSEYLLRAAAAGTLQPINPVVDAGNVVSLHSGLPISVVDLDRLGAAPRVVLAEAGARYVFNSAGQEIDVGLLLCLHDEAGPCANPVKDAMRTKTHAGTLRTLSLIWGHRSLAPRLAQALAWYRELLAPLGATTAEVALRSG